MKLSGYLQAQGLTLQAFGHRVGVSHTTILRWSTGKAAPRGRAMLKRIAEMTGGQVTAADFFPEAVPLRPGLAEQQAPFMEEAAALGLDATAIAARALAQAIQAEKARRWLEANREATTAWNRWTESNELPLAEYRMF